MYEVSFPTKVPTQAALDLYGFVKAGTLKENFPKANAAFYNVQGYVQGVIAGNPDAVNVVGCDDVGSDGECGAEPPLTMEEGLETLKSLSGLSAECDKPAVMTAIPAPMAKFLKFLLTVVLPLLVA